MALFVLRGAAVQVGMRWPRSKPVRLASYAIDTGLLAAGLWLVAILPGGFFAAPRSANSATLTMARPMWACLICG